MVAPHWTNSPSLRLIQNWWRKVMPPLSLWMMAREPRWFSSPISQLRGWYTWQSTGARARKVNKVQRAWILLDCILNYFDVLSTVLRSSGASKWHIQSWCLRQEMAVRQQQPIAPSSWVPQPTKTFLRFSTHTSGRWISKVLDSIRWFVLIQCGATW